MIPISSVISGFTVTPMRFSASYATPTKPIVLIKAAGVYRDVVLIESTDQVALHRPVST